MKEPKIKNEDIIKELIMCGDYEIAPVCHICMEELFKLVSDNFNHFVFSTSAMESDDEKMYRVLITI